MGKIFMKIDSNKYEVIDKETGEISSLKETVVLEEKSFYCLYSDIYCFAISEMKSLVDVKVFAVCLKCAIRDEKYGNIVETGGKFKRELPIFVDITQPALSRSLKNLCEKGLLNRIDRSSYQIHPQIAFCGSRHDRAKVILEIMKK